MDKKVLGEYPRVLVVSNNAFSKVGNNGKTLASFFKKFPSDKIAQLYFNSEIPSDNEYKNFFRVTDNEILMGFYSTKVIGSRINVFDTTSTKSNNKSINPQNQTFQIATLGMKNIHGMVGPLRKLVQDACLPTYLHAGRDDGIIKQLPIYDLRAGKCKQQSAGFYLLDSHNIQALVALHGAVPGRKAFGKRGWVKHDNIKCLIGIFEPLHHILRHRFVTILKTI